MSSKTPLNKQIRHDIARRAAARIPMPKLQGLEKAAQAIIDQDIAQHAPAPIASAWSKRDTRVYLASSTPSIFGRTWGDYDDTPRIYDLDIKHGDGIIKAVSSPCVTTINAHGLSPISLAEIAMIKKEFYAEWAAVNEAVIAMVGLLNSFKTVESLVSTHPEFAPYAPASTPKSYPVALTGVVESLKALGWPQPEAA